MCEVVKFHSAFVTTSALPRTIGFVGFTASGNFADLFRKWVSDMSWSLWHGIGYKRASAVLLLEAEKAGA